MLNINEEDLKSAIVEKASNALLGDGADLSSLVRDEVRKRLDKIFVDRAQAQIEDAISEAVNSSFDREYQRVTSWGEQDGPKTTIRKELEKTINGYWSAKVDNKNGKPSDSGYGSVTRAEYLMTQLCAQDFTETMRHQALNVTGALKDGLRNELAKQMDTLLGSLFNVKSLQDQGKVEKPW